MVSLKRVRLDNIVLVRVFVMLQLIEKGSGIS